MELNSFRINKLKVNLNLEHRTVISSVLIAREQFCNINGYK